jgi:lysophospholipase L1-like esterase
VRKGVSPSVPTRRRFFAAITIIASIVLALAAIEVGLRVGGFTPVYANPLRSFYTRDQDLGYRGKPNFKGRFVRPAFDVVVAHDGNGFRRQERQHPESSSKYRLFCFGDSYTWGWGVGQGEVLTDRLSDLLGDAHIENLGVNASGTVYQWLLFRRDVAPRTRPGDIVLVLFCDNDYGDNVNDDGVEPHCLVRGGEVTVVPPRSTLEPSVKDRLKDASYLFALATLAVDVAKRRVRVERESGKGEEISTVSDEPRRIATSFALEGFAREVHERGARFVVARIPHPAELAARTPDPAATVQSTGFHRAFEEICAGLKIETIDLTPALRADPASGEGGARCYFETDLHWNPLGHARAASGIAPRIREIRRQTDRSSAE